MSTVTEIDAALMAVMTEIQTLERTLTERKQHKDHLEQERKRLVLRQEKEQQAQALRLQQEKEAEALVRIQQEKQAAEDAAEEEGDETDEEYFEEEEDAQDEGVSEEELKRQEARRKQEERIAELKAQIEAVETAAKAAQSAPKSPASPIRRKVTVKKSSPPASPAKEQSGDSSPDSKKKDRKWKTPGWMGGSKKEKVVEPEPTPEPVSVEEPEPTPTSSSPVNNSATEPAKGASELAKQKHQWDRPAWAVAAEAPPDDQAIITEPIQNGLKHNTKPGYSRRVFAKELHKQEGEFITHTDHVPEPRLAWIVLNLDGDKVGKIVMHLEGKDIDKVVKHFVNLKGMEMERTNGTLVINDIEPKLCVSTRSIKPGRGKKTTDSVIGVIQEGFEFFEAVNNAGPEAVVSIKQAHIYPVKKAKGMFYS